MLEELTGHLERMAAERGGVLGVLPSLVVPPDEPGWTPAAELTREPYTLLGELIDETAARWNAPRHVGAALFWKTYCYWHTMPLVLGWALGRRVPVFEGTVFRRSEAGVTIAATSVTVSKDVGGGVEGDAGGAVGAALEREQAPIIRAISGLTRIGERTLWGSTAEAVAHPLAGLADPRPLLRELSLDDLLEWTAEGYRRRTCCLWITLPGAEACTTCCVMPGREAGARPRS
jgi:ferric iron reductase protein FhuF